MPELNSIRGMEEILPERALLWRWLEKKLLHITHHYGYEEIRLPLLESVSLFERAVGETTDIISKQMYHFYDKSGEHITLRPEGTSGCVRSVIENNLCHKHPQQRLWYMGPMFRYEDTQQGRLQQFTQFGVETFGMAGAGIDAELIFMVADIFKALGVEQHVHLEINSVGTQHERHDFLTDLIHYLTQHKHILDEESLLRLQKNPLRILDSKNPAMQQMIEAAPKMLDYLEAESRQHFEMFCTMLQQAGVDYRINPRLVRGLDYYSRTVFEWVTEHLSTQGTLCGGGRYDGLFELFSQRALPCSGFAIGIERLLLLIKAVHSEPDFQHHPDIVIICESRVDHFMALDIANQLRHHFSRLKILSDFSGATLAIQQDNALKHQARYVLTLNANGELGCWDYLQQQHRLLNPASMIAQLQQIFHWSDRLND